MSHKKSLIGCLFIFFFMLTLCNAAIDVTSSTTKTSQQNTTTSQTSATSGGVVPPYTTGTSTSSSTTGSTTSTTSTTGSTSGKPRPTMATTHVTTAPKPPTSSTTGKQSSSSTTSSSSSTTSSSTTTGPDIPVIVGVVELLIRGNVQSFDSPRFGALVNAALKNSNKREVQAEGVVVVSSIASMAVNNTYYAAIIDLFIKSATPVAVLSAIAEKLASYPGFEGHGFIIVSAKWYIQGTALPTSGTNTANVNITIPDGFTTGPLLPIEITADPRRINVIAIVVPVVCGTALVVGIVFGVVYYKRRHSGNQFRFKKAKTPPYSRRHVGGRRARHQPNIWLDMDTLPIPGNTVITV